MKGRQDPKARRPRLFSDYFLTGTLRVNFRSQRKPIYRTVEANFGGSSTLLSFFFFFLNDRCWKSNSALGLHPPPFSSWSLVGDNWCRSRAGRSSFLGDVGPRPGLTEVENCAETWWDFGLRYIKVIFQCTCWGSRFSFPFGLGGLVFQKRWYGFNFHWWVSDEDFKEWYSLTVVQLLSHVGLFVTPWTAARQASLSFTISWRLLKLMSIKSVMLSNHLILWRPLLLLPSVFPSVRVFPTESPHYKIINFQTLTVRTGALPIGSVLALLRAGKLIVKACWWAKRKSQAFFFFFFNCQTL